MRASLIGLLLLACAPIDLLAGVGPVGKSPGEPNGLEEVRIVRENLEIDLRSLTDGKGIGSVDVVYKLDNTGPEITRDLWFVVGSDLEMPATGNGIWLNAERIPAKIVEPDRKRPADWRLPKQTPQLTGKRALTYNVGEERWLKFTATFRPGENVLKVHYQTKLSHRNGSSHRSWQLASILAPGRAWGGFGGLDIVVRIPEGWAFATDPGLQLYKGELLGTYSSVPADALTLTVKAPETIGTRHARPGMVVLWMAYALWTPWLLGRWARRQAKMPPDRFRGFFGIAWGGFGRGMLVGLGHMVLFSLIGLAPDLFVDPAQSEASTGSVGGLLLGMICSTPFVMLAGGMTGWAFALVVARIVYRRQPDDFYRIR